MAKKKGKSKKMSTGLADPKAAGERFKKQRGSGRRVLKDGINRLRILPSWNSDDPSGRYYSSAFYHWDLKEGGLMCPKKTMSPDQDLACAACVESHRLYQGSESDKKKAGRLRAKGRVYLNVIDWDEVDKVGIEKAPVEVIEIPPTVYDEVKVILEEDEDEHGDALDLKKGRWIQIKRSGSGAEGTEYTVKDRGDKAKANIIKQLDRLQDEITDLDEFVEERLPTSEEIEIALGDSRPDASRLIKRQDDDDLDDDDDDDSDDDSDDDDDDDDDDDVMQNVMGKGRKSNKKSAAKKTTAKKKTAAKKAPVKKKAAAKKKAVGKKKK